MYVRIIKAIPMTEGFVGPFTDKAEAETWWEKYLIDHSETLSIVEKPTNNNIYPVTTTPKELDQFLSKTPEASASNRPKPGKPTRIW